MEFCDFVDLNLTRTCRGCLLQNDNMNLLTENGLNLMFTSVTNLKVEIETELPLSLCLDCTDKLGFSYNFQKQCIRSNDILLQYLERSRNVQNEALNESKDADFEITLQSPRGSFDGDDDKNDSRLKFEESEPDVKCSKRKKQTMRLTQYSYDEVTRAIEESKKRFLENAQCIKCGFIGSNMRALSVHISHIHKDMKEKWCSHCNAEFDDLPLHVACHEKADLCCQFCGKLFTAKGHLTEHLRSHSGVRPFKCDVCEKCFISSRHLKVHFRTHTNDRPYKCRYCPKRFIQQNSLKNHLKYHESDDISTCLLCKRVFTQKCDLEKHDCIQNIGLRNDSAQSDDSMPAQNFCKKCNKKVRSLDLHQKQFHSENGSTKAIKYEEGGLEAKLCTVCGKQFKTNSKLKVHMRIHTGEAPYKCSFCDKRVSTRNQLVVHERTHTGERPHICSICGKGFAQSSVLNTHMRLHTGRPEVCQMCGQRFCRPSELKLHMRKHTGEKPFICTECNQTFKQRSHLMEHIKRHSDERPFQCMYCDRGFKQNSSLKSHILIHLGHKPYRCNHCSYACRQSYSLTQHMKQHGEDCLKPERLHVCLMCQTGFASIDVLKNHTISVHNIAYLE